MPLSHCSGSDSRRTHSPRPGEWRNRAFQQRARVHSLLLRLMRQLSPCALAFRLQFCGVAPDLLQPFYLAPASPPRLSAPGGASFRLQGPRGRPPKRSGRGGQEVGLKQEAGWPGFTLVFTTPSVALLSLLCGSDPQRCPGASAPQIHLRRVVLCRLHRSSPESVPGVAFSERSGRSCHDSGESLCRLYLAMRRSPVCRARGARASLGVRSTQKGRLQRDGGDGQHGGRNRSAHLLTPAS